MFHFNSSKKKMLYIIVVISSLNILLLSNLSSFGNAWDNGNDIDNPMITPVGDMPVIDGIKDDSWGDANSSDHTLEDTPISLFIMIKSNYLLVLVEIKGSPHDDNEYLRLLLSNSTDSEVDDFYDAKLIQNRQFDSDNKSFSIIDQHLSEEGTYVNDNISNFEGASNISAGGHSFYEFKIRYSSDNENDTTISASKTFALKIQWGNSVDEDDYGEEHSAALYIQVGGTTPEEDPEITELILDMDIISNITFIVVISAFAIIFIMVYRNKAF